MTRAYSNDLRERVVQAAPGGDSCAVAAYRFGVSKSSAIKRVQLYRQTGSVSPAKMGGHRPVLLEPYRDFIIEQLERISHLALSKLQGLLADQGVKVSRDTVWRFLRREGLSYKKTLFADEHSRRDVAWRRRRWKGFQQQLDPQRLVFIDESWIKTNMAPLRGWGPKGQRLRGFAPHGHWRTMAFLAALRCDQLTAPCVFDGPINGECLRAYVDQQLVPTLKDGDIVIMDNLGIHKSKAVRDAIKAVGARLWFLPPYSPDLNPIEQVFAKIKHWMRMAQKRTIEHAWRHIGHLVGTIQPIECANYFKNAGYDYVKN